MRSSVSGGESARLRCSFSIDRSRIMQSCIRVVSPCACVFGRFVSWPHVRVYVTFGSLTLRLISGECVCVHIPCIEITAWGTTLKLAPCVSGRVVNDRVRVALVCTACFRLCACIRWSLWCAQYWECACTSG